METFFASGLPRATWGDMVILETKLYFNTQIQGGELVWLVTGEQGTDTPG